MGCSALIGSGIFPVFGKARNVRSVCESVHFSCSRSTSRAPEHSRARGRACSGASSWSSQRPLPGLARHEAVPEVVMEASF